MNGLFSPDLATPISELEDAAKANGWPLEVKDGLIGSCTNSSYEDMSRVASLMKQVKTQNSKIVLATALQWSVCGNGHNNDAIIFITCYFSLNFIIAFCYN